METKIQDQMVGIYSIPEAARLLQVSARCLSNWSNGYTYPRKYDTGRMPSVLQTSRLNERIINFAELFELRFVREFRALGVSLEKIRLVAKRLAEELGTDYPFAAEQLYVNGVELVRDVGGQIIRPDTGQIVVEEAKSFCQELSFENSTIALWRPSSGHQNVILRANVRYGDPVIEKFRIPTRSIFHLFTVEQSFKAVQDYFEVDEILVRSAIDFELSLKNAA